MAFFSQVNSLFNNQNQPRKSDALLAPVPGSDPNQPQQQGGGIELSKASTAVQGGGDGGNKAEQGQSADQFTKVNPQGKGFAAKAIVDSNSNGNLQAADAKSYGGNAIADSQMALQNEANKYVTANTYNPQLNQGDLDKAVKSGDKDSFSKTIGLLTAAPKPVADFAYSNQNDVKAEDYVKGLSTTSGLQNALKQQNTKYSDYNDTGATIDALLLGQNQGFKNQQQDLVKQYGAYDQAKSDAVQQAKGVQAKYANDAINEQNNVKGLLTGQYSQELAKRIADARVAKQAQIDRDVTEAQKQASLQGLDASKYFLSSGPLTDADVASAEDKGQFNRIQELLGNGTRLGAARNFGVDFDRLNNDTKAAYEAKKVADAAAVKSAIDAGNPIAGTVAKAPVEVDANRQTTSFAAEQAKKRAEFLAKGGKDEVLPQNVDAVAKEAANKDAWDRINHLGKYALSYSTKKTYSGGKP